MIKAYLATHFFNEAGFKYTAELADRIRKEVPEIDLYVPQENSDINDKSGNDSHITDVTIADGDCYYLDGCNILIANLDGVEIDSGVSAEIGYVAGLITAEGKLSANPKIRYVIGLYTDMRQNGSGDNHFYINLFTKGLVSKHGWVSDSSTDLIDSLKTAVGAIKFDMSHGGVL